MSPRIEDYALIGDMQTAALVGRNGSMDWLCLPSFADAAVFAALLGAKEHGSWLIGPAVATGEQAPYSDRRRYRGDSLVLESEWDTPGGTVRVTDFMPPRNGHAPQVIRVIEGVTGEVEMISEFRPRFRYGRCLPWTEVAEGRTVSISGPNALWLDRPATVSAEGENGAVCSRFTVAAGHRLVFALGWQPSDADDPDVPDAEASLAATMKFWREWVAQCTYHGPYREAVVRSLITLKALTYAPGGTVVAAPTASLPEEIGGVRNGDYLDAWLRAWLSRSRAVAVGALTDQTERAEAAGSEQDIARSPLFSATSPRSHRASATLYGCSTPVPQGP